MKSYYKNYGSSEVQKMTNLEVLCDAFGWSGGTIYLAVDELKTKSPMATEFSISEILAMSKPGLYFLIDQYVRAGEIK